MYIRHIDHRSGAPWGPDGREGGKKFSGREADRKSIFFGLKQGQTINTVTWRPKNWYINF